MYIDKNFHQREISHNISHLVRYICQRTSVFSNLFVTVSRAVSTASSSPLEVAIANSECPKPSVAFVIMFSCAGHTLCRIGFNEIR